MAIVVNFLAGPSSGKTTCCAGLFSLMKSRGFLVEYLPEMAKTLVWLEDFDTLNNQYMLSKRMIDLLDRLRKTKLEYILTDGPILTGLYHNRYNVHNTSNVEKTEQLILEAYRRLPCVNIFIQRGDFAFESAGRLETLEESKVIDTVLKGILDKHGIPYKTFKAGSSTAEDLLEYILSIKF